MSDDNSKIILEMPDMVIISWKSDYAAVEFKITALFNKLRVEYRANTNLSGEFKNQWEFSSGTSQDVMLQTISHDIQKKISFYL